jgi:hypothetical protein
MLILSPVMAAVNLKYTQLHGLFDAVDTLKKSNPKI